MSGGSCTNTLSTRHSAALTGSNVVLTIDTATRYAANNYCFKCINNANTQTSYNLNVKVKADCRSVLTDNGSFSTTYSRVFTANPTSEVIASGWTDLFVLSDSVNCPVTTCSKVTSCSTLAADATTQLTLGADPWSITMKLNDPNGYTKNSANFGINCKAYSVDSEQE